jgi:hypothetical protein
VAGLVNGRAMAGFAIDSLTGFAYRTFPNPASTTAFIEFASPVGCFVTVEVYNGSGGLERLLFSSTVVAGQAYKLALGVAGLSSGTHFCVIRSGGRLYSSRLILVK